MTKRNLIANALLMMLLAMLLVPAQAQFGWPNPNQRPRNDDYRDSGYGNSAAVWSGAVDGEVIIRFRRDNAWVENLSGQGSWNERYRFNTPLSSGVDAVYLNNVRGRGEVVVIEQPSRRNNYTACVLVRDRQRSASNYSFTLNWNASRNRNGDYDNGDWRNRDRNQNDGDDGRNRDRDRNHDNGDNGRNRDRDRNDDWRNRGRN